MKKAIATAVIVAGFALAWSAWPFIGLHAIARAAQTGDLAALEQRIDLPALRRSLTAQLVDTYARVTGLKAPSGLVLGLASVTADPFVEELLTARALAALLRGEWPSAVAAEAPPRLPPLDWSSAKQLFDFYLASRYGITRFSIALPPHAPTDARFRVELSLSGGTWKLSGLTLPAQVEERIVQALMKARGAASVN